MERLDQGDLHLNLEVPIPTLFAGNQTRDFAGGGELSSKELFELIATRNVYT
jgi:hypothetical protein